MGLIWIIGIDIEALEEHIIRAVVDFAQLDEHADTDVQFAGFVFLLSRSANITAASLQFGTEFFLRKLMFKA